MRVVPIACLADNYAYLLIDDATRVAVIVDPSEAAPVLRAFALERAQSADLRAVAIWNTHHHHDHVGGNEEIAKTLGISDVYGHASDAGRIPCQSQFVSDNSVFEFGSSHVRVLHVPGHTRGAIAYVVTHPASDPAIFTGDTLFVAGCGRLFEGTAGRMHESLQKMAALDGKTRVFCGHEYTEANLRFAAHIEPSRRVIHTAQARTRELRRAGSATVPSTVADELAFNPFLRLHSAELRMTLGINEKTPDEEVFAVLRKTKDTF